MAGLPIAVQVVGRRLHEEKVLAYMSVVTECLRKEGTVYEHLNVEDLPEVEGLEEMKRRKVEVDPKKIW
jgi:hypothetical protein